jgi:hypothetical protein
MPSAQVFRYDQIQALSLGFGGGESEHDFGTAVPEPDKAFMVGKHDGVTVMLYDLLTQRCKRQVVHGVLLGFFSS